ncbi:hypothetical protein ACIPEN_12065 [Herbaspirillum chlorophenolicum]|uniref:Transmembrane protein n=1 Tax=Herbaspirillum chlorophenolicum TaxID=211589 RepID=A0ABW8EZU1_9BURK
MEMVLGLFAGLLRMLAFYSVFYAIGSLILKVLTLGRYPHIRHLRENARQGFPEFELVAIFGLLCMIALVILCSKLMG